MSQEGAFFMRARWAVLAVLMATACNGVGPFEGGGSDGLAITPQGVVLGAIGADLVNGLQALARKRRMVIERIEAVVEGELNNSLAYLGVIGEPGHPGLQRVQVKVYVASLEEEVMIQRLWQEVLATSPLVYTFQGAIQLDLRLQMAG